MRAGQEARPILSLRATCNQWFLHDCIAIFGELVMIGNIIQFLLKALHFRLYSQDKYMVPDVTNNKAYNEGTRENLAYIRQMLAELRLVANREGADMLCYLIEMAYVEVGDIQSGQRKLSIREERNPPPGMPV
ncbi:hypothetical protein P3T31_000607 [Rhizobium sp. AN70]|nr:hypothetical protein [Rhizobium sp. AN70]